MRFLVSFLVGTVFVCACHTEARKAASSPGSSEPQSDSPVPDRIEVSAAQPALGCAEVKTWRIGFPGTAPVIVKRVDPIIADSTLSATRGVVTVEAVVDRTGSVCEATVVRSLGPGVDRAVVAAVKEWRFKPAMLNGEPQQVAYNISIPIGP
jgi:TonB family protein